MYIKQRIGLGMRDVIMGTVSRETCEVCGQFTRVYVKTYESEQSYTCANPNCGGELHENNRNVIQSITGQPQN